MDQIKSDAHDSDSIGAYDLPDRVQRYDADMDVMHPLRWKMIEVALETLPFERSASLCAADLGVGTGAFAREFLSRFPESRLTAIDGAKAMFELAKTRMGDLGAEIEWVVADFRSIPVGVLEEESFDVVFSSYALHHLDQEEKCSLLELVLRALKPGGWFLNADVFVAEDSVIESQIQQLRVEGVVNRAAENDQRFRTVDSTRAFLDKLEEEENDQPQTLSEELNTLIRAGFSQPTVLWKEFREAVFAAVRK